MVGRWVGEHTGRASQHKALSLVSASQIWLLVSASKLVLIQCAPPHLEMGTSEVHMLI